MKKIIASASALLLSSSALAASLPTTTAYPVGNYAWAANPQLTHAAWTGAMSYAEAANWTGDKPMELSEDQMAEKSMWLASSTTGSMDAVGKLAELSDEQIAEKTMWLASNSTMDEMGKLAALSDDQIAEKDMWLASNAVQQVNTELAAGKPMGAEYNGVGGPDESTEAERTSWPACDPGPGDDRCIQLYEPGVRGAFAQWSAGRDRMAMGGPEEPVIGKEAMAMSSADMSSSTVDKPIVGAQPTTEPTGVRVAKTSSTPFEHASLTAEEMRSGPVYSGVGGPLEEVRDYPRCRSRSDDRCQQGS